MQAQMKMADLPYQMKRIITRTQKYDEFTPEGRKTLENSMASVCDRLNIDVGDVMINFITELGRRLQPNSKHIRAMSWNACGLNTNKKMVQLLTLDHGMDFTVLQESKHLKFSLQKYVLPTDREFITVNATEAADDGFSNSGGLVIMWNPQVLRHIADLSTRHTLTAIFEIDVYGGRCCFAVTDVYCPPKSGCKQRDFWDEMHGVWEELRKTNVVFWLTGGDFNATLNDSEVHSQEYNFQNRENLLDFLRTYNMHINPLTNHRFTRQSADENDGARVDRWANDRREVSCHKTHAYLGRESIRDLEGVTCLSDHYPVVLDLSLVADDAIQDAVNEAVDAVVGVNWVVET